MQKVATFLLMVGATLAALAWGLPGRAAAATLCVNPGGTSGCYPTITKAVAAASAGDVIVVEPGEYDEAVVIGKPLSLIGENAKGEGDNGEADLRDDEQLSFDGEDAEGAIVNAAGLDQGIYIDGVDHPGLSDVVVAGLAVENANYEGILVANSSSVTLRGNHVMNNNLKLTPPNTCPGLAAELPFETNEGLDCGEGIHLTGVSQSTISGNVVEGNSGGILVADETGSTHDNVISGNAVSNNPFDCGITLASHSPAPGTGKTPHGVFENTIADNTVSHNGDQKPGAGAGVGIFVSSPGTMNYGNAIVRNRLTDNGLPGVVFHTHIPGVFIHDNIVAENYIAGNGPDSGDAKTAGPTGIDVFGVSPITGTVIAGNVIKDEAIDVSVHTVAQVNVHLNNLAGGAVGVSNTAVSFKGSVLGTGTVDATENWWGCAAGPAASGCASVTGSGVLFDPWLTRPATRVAPGDSN